MLPIQVNGNFAVWQQLTVSKKTDNPIGADIFLYDIGAATTTKIPETVPASLGLYRAVRPGGHLDDRGWALLHALEHLREHAAQALLTRQLWGTHPD